MKSLLSKTISLEICTGLKLLLHLIIQMVKQKEGKPLEIGPTTSSLPSNHFNKELIMKKLVKGFALLLSVGSISVGLSSCGVSALMSDGYGYGESGGYYGGSVYDRPVYRDYGYEREEAYRREVARQRELERQRQYQYERERQHQRELARQREYQYQRERDRQRELANARERELQREYERQRQYQQQQRELDRQRQREQQQRKYDQQRQYQEQKKYEQERQRELIRERERQRQYERQYQQQQQQQRRKSVPDHSSYVENNKDNPATLESLRKGNDMPYQQRQEPQPIQILR